VFRATHMHLGRDAALKVLPPEFPPYRERLSRLEREARAASALKHPNIVTIHRCRFVCSQNSKQLSHAHVLGAGRTVQRLSETAENGSPNPSFPCPTDFGYGHQRGAEPYSKRGI
jgi:serine/threonine protein kinase